MKVDEDRLCDEMAVEFRQLEAAGAVLALGLDPFVALQLCGMLQLLLRRPDLPATHRLVAAQLRDSIAEWFSGCEAISEVIRSLSSDERELHGRAERGVDATARPDEPREQLAGGDIRPAAGVMLKGE